jgi:hypothetical protein
MNMIKDTISSGGTNQHETHTSKVVSQDITSSFSVKSNVIENVLILQGGGSLGTFGFDV